MNTSECSELILYMYHSQNESLEENESLEQNESSGRSIFYFVVVRKFVW